MKDQNASMDYDQIASTDLLIDKLMLLMHTYFRVLSFHKKAIDICL